MSVNEYFGGILGPSRKAFRSELYDPDNLAELRIGTMWPVWNALTPAHESVFGVNLFTEPRLLIAEGVRRQL